MVVGRYLFPWQEVLKYIVLMADENNRAIEVFNEFKDKKILIRLVRVLRILF